MNLAAVVFDDSLDQTETEAHPTRMRRPRQIDSASTEWSDFSSQPTPPSRESFSS